MSLAKKIEFYFLYCTMLGHYYCCRLNAAVTPWLDKPYQEQLKLKQEALKAVLKQMAYKITHKDSHPVSVIAFSK